MMLHWLSLSSKQNVKNCTIFKKKRQKNILVVDQATSNSSSDLLICEYCKRCTWSRLVQGSGVTRVCGGQMKQPCTVGRQAMVLWRTEDDLRAQELQEEANRSLSDRTERMEPGREPTRSRNSDSKRLIKSQETPKSASQNLDVWHKAPCACVRLNQRCPWTDCTSVFVSSLLS